MDGLELIHGQLAAFSLHIQNLPSHHTKGTSRQRQLCYQLYLDLTRELCHCHQTIRIQKERISRQNGHILPEFLVAGQTASAVVIIIHSWQIIMDQATGVNHL